jgi:thiol-disulfide isomerase/thioredoxin
MSNPTFLFLGASWCGPCNRIKPIWEEMKATYSNAVFNFYDIDTDEGRALAMKHGVKGVPFVASLSASGGVQATLKSPSLLRDFITGICHQVGP